MPGLQNHAANLIAKLDARDHVSGIAAAENVSFTPPLT
jgi:hypothetical protein